MRISFVILSIQLCCTALLLANSIHAQNITVDVKNVPVKKVFNNIESQAAISFVCDDKMLQGIPPITIKVNNTPLNEVLSQLEKQTPLRFKQSGRLIGVSRIKANIIGDVFQPIEEQSFEHTNLNISGKITDESGTALSGATVRVEGTQIATTTNADGKFQLANVPDGSKLLITFIGYDTKEVTASENIIVVLSSSTSKLDEVHVIAYGTTTQRLSTGSVSKVTAEEIEKQPVSNPLAALEGRVPGLLITQNSGLPGGNFTVQIRGRTSIENKSNPLYIIDGVPYNATSLDQISGGTSISAQNPFSSINPQDIESIEVLKDADATAIYGSRGANGVILITMKKGKVGSTVFSANIYSGEGQVARTIDYLNTDQYLMVRREAFKNDGITPTIANAPDLLAWDNNRYTDWKSLLIGGTAKTTDVQASISGGSNTTNFLIGTNYHHETTVFPGDLADNKVNVHINLNHRSPNQKFYINFSTIYNNDQNNLISRDLASVITLAPNAPVPYDAQGKLNWSEGGVYYNNPLAYIQQPYTGISDNLISNADIQYTVFPGLKLKSNFGYDLTFLKQTQLNPKSSINPSTSTTSSAFFGNNSDKSWIIEPQAEYTKNIGLHKFDVLIGATWQREVTDGKSITATNFVSDALIENPASAASQSIITNYTDYRYQALFARLNYNFNDKYIINVTGRRDGSSRFGPGKQFANFGSIGAAWLFSEENFIKENLPYLSFGKLRSSYGITGNDKIGDYKFMDTWSSTTSPYQGISGLLASGLNNPTYAWELNKKMEVSLDLGFFHDRILFNASYYRNRSSNELIKYALPAQTGFSGILENFPALVQNSGWEYSISTINFKKSDFKWSTSFNVSFARNKLLSFPGLESSTYASTYLIGYPLDIVKYLPFTGVDSQTGVYTFTSTSLTTGKTSIKDLTPKFYGGIQNDITYKGFELSFFFQFVKTEAFNYNSTIAATYPGTMANQPAYILQRWQNPGDISTIGKFTATSGTAAYSADQNYYSYSDAKVSDGSFIRLKNLYFGYTLPSRWINKTKAKMLKVYMQAQNLFTITNYLGNDPESGSANGFNLPPLRVITAGLQFTY